MKLAIVGSREFKKENKVKALLESYIQRYGFENVTVVSGGCPDGADALAKKAALEMGLQYIEFPPKHRCHNEYCIRPPEEYGKEYHVSNFFVRNSQVAEFCEHLVAFTIKGVRCNGTMDTYGKAKRMNKKCLLFENTD
jgi:predicted Rossmann-fold nucleotide-binding protein